MLFWAFLLIPLLIVASMSTAATMIVAGIILLLMLVLGDWEGVKFMLPGLLLGSFLVWIGSDRNHDQKRLEA